VIEDGLQELFLLPDALLVLEHRGDVSHDVHDALLAVALEHGHGHVAPELGAVLAAQAHARPARATHGLELGRDHRDLGALAGRRQRLHLDLAELFVGVAEQGARARALLDTAGSLEIEHQHRVRVGCEQRLIMRIDGAQPRAHLVELCDQLVSCLGCVVHVRTCRYGTTQYQSTTE
jgi:hypothetical protein